MITQLAPKVAPWSDQNIIYKDIIGAIGRSTSGDKNWTLGGWIYDITLELTGAAKRLPVE